MSGFRPLYWTIYRNSTYGRKINDKGRMCGNKNMFVYSTTHVKYKLQNTVSVSFVLVDVEIFK